MVGEIRLGTSAFTAAGWSGSFYPRGMKSADYLAFYSTKFDTVEIDSSFYGCPSIATLNHWALRTPPGFVFALKVPRIITHEKILMDCDREIEEFLSVVRGLGQKLGPIVFQFPFFNSEVFNSPVQFLSRLRAVLKKLSQLDGYKFAVEIRNKFWFKPRLTDLLSEYKFALTLQDHSSMQSPERVFSEIDPITSDFTIIRLLGNRKAIEAKTTVWNQIVDDKTPAMQSWVNVCQMIQKRGVTQYIYANNHYQGCGYRTVEQLRSLFKEAGTTTPLHVRPPATLTGNLFETLPT